MNTKRKLKRRWKIIASMIFSILIAVAIVFYFTKKSVPANLTEAELSASWRTGTLDERTALLPHILGKDWSRGGVVRDILHPEKSILWKMTKDEVIDLLGPPDAVATSDNWVIYNVGLIEKSGVIDSIVDLIPPSGLGPVEQSLFIYFDENDSVKKLAVK